MVVLLVGTYQKFNTNEYIKYVADAYMKNGIQVIFEEQNFMFSNFIPDIVHIQWPEALYRWKNLFTQDDNGLEKQKNRLIWYKKNKSKIVYTVHNLLPHDNANEFDKKVYEIILGYADIIAHHGKSSINIIKEYYPNTKKSKHIIAPHGPYKVENLPLKVKARKKYDLPNDKIVFTNFGLQRAYKGQEFSYNVFKKINDNNICFFSIGKLVGEKLNIDLSDTKTFIKYKYQSVPNDEVKYIISATDVFFLGHKSGLNSGLISLAISYKKPIIFPDIGNFKEQAKGWELYETYEVNNLKSAQFAINNIQKKLNIEKDNNKWLQINSWDKHVKNILQELIL